MADKRDGYKRPTIEQRPPLPEDLCLLHKKLLSIILKFISNPKEKVGKKLIGRAFRNSLRTRLAWSSSDTFIQRSSTNRNHYLINGVHYLSFSLYRPAAETVLSRNRYIKEITTITDLLPICHFGVYETIKKLGTDTFLYLHTLKLNANKSSSETIKISELIDALSNQLKCLKLYNMKFDKKTEAATFWQAVGACVNLKSFCFTYYSGGEEWTTAEMIATALKGKTIKSLELYGACDVDDLVKIIYSLENDGRKVLPKHLGFTNYRKGFLTDLIEQLPDEYKSNLKRLIIEDHGEENTVNVDPDWPIMMQFLQLCSRLKVLTLSIDFMKDAEKIADLLKDYFEILYDSSGLLKLQYIAIDVGEVLYSFKEEICELLDRNDKCYLILPENSTGRDYIEVRRYDKDGCIRLYYRLWLMEQGSDNCKPVQDRHYVNTKLNKLKSLSITEHRHTPPEDPCQLHNDLLPIILKFVRNPSEKLSKELVCRAFRDSLRTHDAWSNFTAGRGYNICSTVWDMTKKLRTKGYHHLHSLRFNVHTSETKAIHIFQLIAALSSQLQSLKLYDLRFEDEREMIKFWMAVNACVNLKKFSYRINEDCSPIMPPAEMIAAALKGKAISSLKVNHYYYHNNHFHSKDLLDMIPTFKINREQQLLSRFGFACNDPFSVEEFLKLIPKKYWSDIRDLCIWNHLWATASAFPWPYLLVLLGLCPKLKRLTLRDFHFTEICDLIIAYFNVLYDAADLHSFDYDKLLDESDALHPLDHIALHPKYRSDAAELRSYEQDDLIERCVLLERDHHCHVTLLNDLKGRKYINVQRQGKDGSFRLYCSRKKSSWNAFNTLKFSKNIVFP